MNEWEQQIKDESLHEIDMMFHPAIQPIKYYSKARCQKCRCVQDASLPKCKRCGSYDLEDFITSDF